MKLKSNRAILFARVNENVESLLSLITITKDALALSDEQIKSIDERLLVHSLQEFEDKFAVDFNNMGITYKKEEALISSSKVFFDSLICSECREEFKIWYYNKNESQHNKQSMDTVDINLYEIWLGVKCFFEQGANLELLVTNASYEDWENGQATEKLAIYIDTVNGKLENKQKLAVAIFPQIPITSENRTFARKRFVGSTFTNILQESVYIALSKVLNIICAGKITICYQFVTNEKTGFKIVAREGREHIIREAQFFQEKVNADDILCCYPNLTWMEDTVYVGAAYVVAGMILAEKKEKNATTLPREMYPYGTTIWEELGSVPYGAMLAYNPKNAGSSMLLWWLRSPRWRNGVYGIE